MHKRTRNGCVPIVHAVSAKTGSGIEDLKKDIARVVYRDEEMDDLTDAPDPDEKEI
jgi:selenocysteine-specific translation elongation factor